MEEDPALGPRSTKEGSHPVSWHSQVLWAWLWVPALLLAN